MSFVEDFSGIDVNNNYVAVKKEKTVFDMILHIYVLDLGLTSKLVVSNETYWVMFSCIWNILTIQ